MPSREQRVQKDNNLQGSKRGKGEKKKNRLDIRFACLTFGAIIAAHKGLRSGPGGRIQSKHPPLDEGMGRAESPLRLQP